MSSSSSARLPLAAARSAAAAAAAKRSMSAAAAVAKSGRQAAGQTEVSKLSNGLTLVSLPSANSHACTLGVCVRAGARFEPYAALGATHLIKTGFGSSTTGQFDRVTVTKNMQYAGANATCKTEREFIFYSMQPERQRLDQAVDYFLDAATNAKFKRHELMRTFPRLELDVQTQCTQTRVTDMLHRAAFRSGGLGNGIVCPEFMVKKHSEDVMKQFYSENFKTGNAALVGVGIDMSVLSDLAGLIQMPEGKGASTAKATYYGGELRQDAAGSNATVMLANQIAGWGNDMKAAAAACVLGTIIDCDHTGGLGSIASVQDAIGSIASARPVIHMYSDSGLFGVAIDASADQAGKAVEKAAAFLRSLNVTADAVTAAKNSLVASSYEFSCDARAMAEDQAAQAVLTGDVLGMSGWAQAVQAITEADVKAVAKNLGSGKLSMAAYGNLKTVPYLDTL